MLPLALCDEKLALLFTTALCVINLDAFLTEQLFGLFQHSVVGCGCSVLC
jgi:hypothetical protein